MVRLYIRCDDQTSLDHVRHRFPNAIIEQPSVFASVPIACEDWMEPGEIDQLSGELDAEIIFLAYSSVSESLQFSRSVSGKTVRHLQYGMHWEQGLWDEVKGTAEEWETAAFFSHNMPPQIPPDAPNRKRIADIYAERILSHGEVHPMIDARESARAAAIHYRLTDWLDDWQDADNHSASAVQSFSAPRAIAPTAKANPWWRFW